ncbi:MAG: hypothetical protein O3A87_10165 [Verrucomicrobia bacterium]|nr:hypothetical protein [Verrucomicrobiota bacterium]MDA1006824.1 hypothetical protein [Verrucomicrobiota bacterium]
MTKTVLILLAAGGVASAQDFLENEAPNLGGILFPSLHAAAVYGDSSRDPADLAAHGHDPNDQFTLQGIEAGLSLRAGEYLEGFANGVLFMDLEDDFDTEWEEAFLKLANLPGGFEVRGGRMLNRVGRQNATHLHAWDFVDANLLTSRFLGDEGLITNSVELTWLVPTPFESALSIAFGETVPHEEHAHGDEEEHEGEEEEEEEEHELEGEDGLFDTDVLTLRYEGIWHYNDFHRFRFGGSFLVGDNRFMRTTTATGLDFEYGYYENGLEGGGRSVRWRTEVMCREVEYQHEDGDGRGTSDELGLSTQVLMGLTEDWTAGLRYDWVEGSDDLHELPERHRLSAAVTRHLSFGDDADGWVRLQVNHEDHEEYGDECSVWVQFGLNWGGAEVR